MSQYIIHTVGMGDTIQSIGLSYGVRWEEIVQVNGLEYPYIDDNLYINEYNEVDSVAKVGSKLVIPTPGIKIPVKSNNSSKEMEEYIFGVDLDLFSSFLESSSVMRLEIEGELSHNQKGDLKLSSGIDNLRQQLIIKLGTPKGSLLLHPEFGSRINDFVGKKITIETLTKVKLEVQECLLGDFRVSGISDLSVIGKDGGIFVECIIHPIESYPSAFRLSHLFKS